MDKNISACWLLTVVPTSIFLGYITNSYEYFSIEKEINLVDLFNLIITIFIAFYFSNYLQKQTEQNKIEKDFIINKLKPILKDCESIKNCVENNNLGKKKIDELLSNISNGLYYSNQFSIICDKKIGIDELKNKMFVVKRQITEKIKDRKYLVQDIRLSLKEIEEFEKLLFKQIIDINKM